MVGLNKNRGIISSYETVLVFLHRVNRLKERWRDGGKRGEEWGKERWS